MQKAHAEKEKDVKAYRIGSSGAVIGSEVYGTCHRIAHLRDIGVEVPPDLGTDIMWKAGEGNEDTWLRILEAAGFDGEILTQDKAEAQIDGVDQPIQGHPDLILRTKTDGDIGVELKGIFGWTTAELAWIKHTPKNENLIQAAGYSYYRKIPYILAYTCNHFPKIPPWEKKKIIHLLQAEFGKDWMMPFYSIFYLNWENDRLQYKHEAEDKWITTDVTPETIDNYYRLLTEMKQTKQLGPRVSANYLDGTPHKYGAQAECGLCEFNAMCDRYEGDKDYDRWLDDIKTMVAGMPRIGDET